MKFRFMKKEDEGKSIIGKEELQNQKISINVVMGILDDMIGQAVKPESKNALKNVKIKIYDWVMRRK